MTLTIEYETNPNYEDEQILGNGIIEYAQLKKGHVPIKCFAYFIRDENNKIRGGCKGSLFYGCMYVDLLWLEESIVTAPSTTFLRRNQKVIKMLDLSRSIQNERIKC